MNRNTLRMAAVSAATAIVLGGTAGLAQASSAPAASPQAITVTQQAEAQQAARALLASSLAGSFSTAERAEISKVALGGVSASKKGKWDIIAAAFSKVKGFSKAVGGKYSDFKKWYDGLPLYVKLPLQAVSPTLTLLEIYNALH